MRSDSVNNLFGQTHLPHFCAAAWQDSRGILVVCRHEGRPRPRSRLYIASNILDEKTALPHQGADTTKPSALHRYLAGLFDEGDFRT